IEEVVARAQAASSLVLRARATARVRQASLGMQRSNRWPTISLGGGVNRASSGVDQSALFDLSPDGLGGRLSLSVSIPVFSRFQTSFDIGRADVDYRNSLQETRLTELEVEETVRARYVDLDVAWSTLQESARGLELAEERLRMVREEYRLVAKTFEELQGAVRQAAVQRRAAIDERFAFATALLDLYAAAGIVAQEAGLSDPDPSAN
ncbi:MAG: TolC family protein, partial [Longimicrobiales bacterium]